jgi:hypothetical protein
MYYQQQPPPEQNPSYAQNNPYAQNQNPQYAQQYPPPQQTYPPQYATPAYNPQADAPNRYYQAEHPTTPINVIVCIVQFSKLEQRGNEQKFPEASKYRDLFWAILFIVHMIAVIALCAVGTK